MTDPRAAVVATELAREWRRLHSATGLPRAPDLVAATEAALALAAEGLLDEVLSGLAVDEPAGPRFLVVQRWTFAPARPPLRPRWPLPSRVADCARFVLRFRLGTSWARLVRSQRAGANGLPLALAPAARPIAVPAPLCPVASARLPGGGHLVLETLPHPGPGEVRPS
jgi:hypothetical protein